MPIGYGAPAPTVVPAAGVQIMPGAAQPALVPGMAQKSRACRPECAFGAGAHRPGPGLALSNNSLNFSLKGRQRQGDGGGASKARMRSLSNAVVAPAEAANASTPIWSYVPDGTCLDISVLEKVMLTQMEHRSNWRRPSQNGAPPWSALSKSARNLMASFTLDFGLFLNSRALTSSRLTESGVT
jgi:hypothetical protein